MRSRRRNSNHSDGITFVAFGVGLLACTICPTKLVVVLLAAALVLCGLSCGKR